MTMPRNSQNARRTSKKAFIADWRSRWSQSGRVITDYRRKKFQDCMVNERSSYFNIFSRMCQKYSNLTVPYANGNPHRYYAQKLALARGIWFLEEQSRQHLTNYPLLRLRNLLPLTSLPLLLLREWEEFGANGNSKHRQRSLKALQKAPK